MKLFDRKYWEHKVKRQITDAEFNAASAAALHAGDIDRRARKRIGLEALRKAKHKTLAQ
jgi:hypothetical protein